MSGIWNFQVHPTFWFGMALCDTESYPNVSSTCTPDSESNIKNSPDPSSPSYIGKHAGTSFMELQLYPPGYTTDISCAARQWCAAMTIDGVSDSLTNNLDCLERAGEEYQDFAYLTFSGVTQDPPDPLNGDAIGTPAGPSVLFMNPGDRITVSIHDSLAGLVTTIVDNTTGQTGPMTARRVPGQRRRLQRQLVPAGLAGNAREPGPRPAAARAAVALHEAAGERAELPADGARDRPARDRVRAGLRRGDGAYCTNPPSGAAFYPFYSTTTIGGTCAWREGGRFMPRTTNLFGGSSAAEFGPLLGLYYAPEVGLPAGTFFEDYRNVLAGYACPSAG